jgi:GTP-binding protein HflX
VYAADQLFATLDPTMRRIELPGKASVILGDTVGFIRHLPHDLVEAFKSTLEEVAEADLLLHVVDAANPERLEQIQQVNNVLAEIEAQSIPQLMVFNKIDLTGEAPRFERDANGHISRLWVSAHTGEGMDLLLQALADHFRRHRQRYRFCLPPEAGRLRAVLYERFDVIRETAPETGGWMLELALEPAQLAWLQQQNDFRESYQVPEAESILAPTGS